MGQVVEKTAKTISQALAEALEELGVSEEQVDYEVLEYPSKGLFGVLGAKPARIRVKLRESRYRRHHEPERKEKEATEWVLVNIELCKSKWNEYCGGERK